MQLLWREQWAQRWGPRADEAPRPPSAGMRCGNQCQRPQAHALPYPPPPHLQRVLLLLAPVIIAVPARRRRLCAAPRQRRPPASAAAAAVWRGSCLLALLLLLTERAHLQPKRKAPHGRGRPGALPTAKRLRRGLLVSAACRRPGGWPRRPRGGPRVPPCRRAGLRFDTDRRRIGQQLPRWRLLGSGWQRVVRKHANGPPRARRAGGRSKGGLAAGSAGERGGAGMVGGGRPRVAPRAGARARSDGPGRGAGYARAWGGDDGDWRLVTSPAGLLLRLPGLLLLLLLPPWLDAVTRSAKQLLKAVLSGRAAGERRAAALAAAAEGVRRQGAAIGGGARRG